MRKTTKRTPQEQAAILLPAICHDQRRAIQDLKNLGAQSFCCEHARAQEAARLKSDILTCESIISGLLKVLKGETVAPETSPSNRS